MIPTATVALDHISATPMDAVTTAIVIALAVVAVMVIGSQILNRRKDKEAK